LRHFFSSKLYSTTFQAIPTLRFCKVRILVPIRYIPIVRGTSNSILPPSIQADDLVAACFGIQRQLESQKWKTATAAIEESCILSAHMYIDTILLHTPLKVVLKSTANRQLQQAMMQSKSARDLEENKEILDWIAATAAIGVCINESEG
jgi:hypothetical protein